MGLASKPAPSRNDPGRAKLRASSRPSASYFSASRPLLRDQRESATTSVRFCAVQRIRSTPVLVGSSQRSITRDLIAERLGLTLAQSSTPALSPEVEVCADVSQADGVSGGHSTRLHSTPADVSQLESDKRVGSRSEQALASVPAPALLSAARALVVVPSVGSVIATPVSAVAVSDPASPDLSLCAATPASKSEVVVCDEPV